MLCCNRSSHIVESQDCFCLFVLAATRLRCGSPRPLALGLALSTTRQVSKCSAGPQAQPEPQARRPRGGATPLAARAPPRTGSKTGLRRAIKIQIHATARAARTPSQIHVTCTCVTCTTCVTFVYMYMLLLHHVRHVSALTSAAPPQSKQKHRASAPQNGSLTRVTPPVAPRCLSGLRQAITPGGAS